MNKLMKLIIMLSIGLSILSCGKKEEKIQDTTFKIVEAMEVKKGDVLKETMSSGTLDSLNEEIKITRTGGEVKKIYAKNGDKVKKGTLIVELTNQDIKSSYLDAKSELHTSKVKLEITKTRYNKFKTLYSEELISEDEFLNVKNTYIESSASLEEAKAKFYKANDNYEKLKLKSEINGVVADLDLKKYQSVMPNDRVFRVVDTEKLRILTSVSAKYISSLKVGAVANLTIDGFENQFQCTVYEINPVIDPDTKKYQVKLLVDSENGTLKQGMFAKVKLVAGKKQGYLVPKKAIMVEELYSYIVLLEKKEVEIIKDGETKKEEEFIAKKVRVDIGYANGDMQEIMSDQLKDNMKVVISGQYSLEDDDIVEIK